MITPGPYQTRCNRTYCQTRRNAIGEMSARDTGGAKQGCSLTLYYEMKCEKNSMIWCDNQKNERIGFLLFLNFLNAINSGQLRKSSFTTWIGGTQCTTGSWILLALATDQITCFALLNHVPTFFPAYSPGLMPVMAVSVLVINGVTHLKVVIYKWPWHGIITFLCLCNRV